MFDFDILQDFIIEGVRASLMEEKPRRSTFFSYRIPTPRKDDTTKVPI